MQMTKPQQNQTQCRLNAFRVIMITFQVGDAHRSVCVCVRAGALSLLFIVIFLQLCPLFAILIKV